MAWLIACLDSTCTKKSSADNIVDLVKNHLDNNYRLRCPCGKHGYVEKSFRLQEHGEEWKPILMGIIPLGKGGDTYQPFVFLVSYEPRGEITDVWFSYYKDLRASGGRLKLGYGPGGPPVLGKTELLNLLSRLAQTRYFKREEIATAIGKLEQPKANPKAED